MSEHRVPEFASQVSPSEPATRARVFERVEAAAAVVRAAMAPRRPAVALVLGSGLGSFADQVEDAVRIPYASLPGFPRPAVAGHQGTLVVGQVATCPVAVLAGRVHYYEGYPLEEVVFPVRTLIAAGCRVVLLTNAAGAVSASLAPGDLVCISDHLNLLGANPLRGANDQRLGPRFPDLTHAYDPGLRALARRAAASCGFELAEGVYAALPGPSYETPAEIRMVGLLGADLAGMSTVPEAIAAVHQGARVLAFSCVTNLAAGRSPTPLCHSEVTEVAARSRGRFRQLLAAVLSLLAAEAQAGGGYEGDTGNNRGNASTGAGEAGNTGRTRDGGRSEGTDGPGEPR